MCHRFVEDLCLLYSLLRRLDCGPQFALNKSMKFTTLTLCFLFLTISCGKSLHESKPPGQEREVADFNDTDTWENAPMGRRQPTTPWSNAFSTRVNPQLALSGVKCTGEESIEVNWQGAPVFYRCHPGQWLIVIDEKNICDNSGCTQIMIQPFIANLRFEFVNSSQNVAFYHIRPISPLDRESWQVVHSYWVRFEKNQNPKIVLKSVRQ